MRLERLVSWALAAAFVAVVGLAAADAVRKRDKAPEPSATTAADPEHERLVVRLRQAGIRGQLVVTTPAGCPTEVWSLPELARAAADRPCRPPPEPGLAERPDGHRSLVDEQGIVLLLRSCDGSPACRRVLIPRAALERAGRHHPNVPARPSRLAVLVDEVAWLTETRAAVLLSLRIRIGAGRPDLRGQQLLAIFDSARLEAVRSYFRGDLTQLRASADGAYVAFLPRYVVRADGSALDSPVLPQRARALAWSPDGRWLALAQRGSVMLVSIPSLERHRATGASVRTIDLPIQAAALEWR